VKAGPSQQIFSWFQTALGRFLELFASWDAPKPQKSWPSKSRPLVHFLEFGIESLTQKPALPCNTSQRRPFSFMAFLGGLFGQIPLCRPDANAKPAFHVLNRSGIMGLVGIVKCRQSQFEAEVRFLGFEAKKVETLFIKTLKFKSRKTS
jgi:hypothetical protein